MGEGIGWSGGITRMVCGLVVYGSLCFFDLCVWLVVGTVFNVDLDSAGDQSIILRCVVKVFWTQF